MAGKTISAVLITKNEERNIGRALRSLEFADEVIVLDGESSDRTMEVCRAAGARVEVKEWDGFVAQKNAAVQLAECDWILSLDADEEVTPELREEVLRVVADPGEKVGFFIPRKNFYLGRWIRHCGWYPDYQLRLWRRGRGRWVGGRVHERVEIEGEAGHLRAALNHFSYNSIGEHLLRMNRYAELIARDKFEQGKRAGLAGLMFAAPWQFFKLYILRGGILDGLYGLLVSAMGAHYAFLRKAKLWELQHERKPKSGDGRDG
jgi:glycosyltransferase involved in cell wall biosynthesis